MTPITPTEIRYIKLGSGGLSTILTQVAAYRQTICRIKPSGYRDRPVILSVANSYSRGDWEFE